jgi:hypothetical protein
VKAQEKTTENVEILSKEKMTDAARLVDEFWMLLYSDHPADLDTKIKLVDTVKRLRYLMKKKPEKIRSGEKKKSKKSEKKSKKS